MRRANSPQPEVSLVAEIYMPLLGYHLVEHVVTPSATDLLFQKTD